MNLKISDRIRNRKVDFFNNFKLDLRYDSVGSTFSFAFYYDSNNSEHRELACVSHYHIATVEHDGELLLTGYILSEAFNWSSQKQLVSFGGYSLPGVLEDCQIPTSSYPLQSDGLTLRQIASKFLSPFKLDMVVDASVSTKMDQPYPKTTASATASVKDYLTELATQKDIVITHNEKGQVVFTSAKVNQKAVMDFDFTKTVPGTSFALSFSGQPIHSDITVVKQADKDGGNAGEFTIQNPLVPIVYRPKVIIQSSGDDIDTQQAARQAMAEELKNIVLTITTDRWVVDGKILKPNNIITITAPDLYLFKKTKFFIESISFSGDNKQLIATITCVLPEVYNGNTPLNVFVSDHLKQNRIE